MSEENEHTTGVSRRTLFRLGAAGGVGVALAGASVSAPYLSQKGLLSLDGAFGATSTQLADSLFYIEAFPVSPLILTPFRDELPVPKALRPEPYDGSTNWAKPRKLPNKPATFNSWEN